MIGLDFGFGAIEAEFWRWAFLMIRIGAALLAAPIFGALAVPAQVRVIAAAAIALPVAAYTDVAPPPVLLSLAGMLAVAGEVMIGLAMGFVLQLVFAAPVIAAELIGGAMGMTLAQTIDPNSGSGTPAFGQYFTLLLTLAFLAVDAHLHFLALVIESFRALPPGAPIDLAGTGGRIGSFGGEMLTMAVSLALPVTALLVIVNIVSGVISRTAPSLNLFALGLPLGVMAGIVALAMTGPLLADRFIAMSQEAPGQAHALVIGPE